MSDPGEAAAEFLIERPELVEAFRTLLRVDAEDRPWEFADVPLDSGQFGEVVSRGIAEGVDGGYRLADREAVRAAVEAAADDAAAAGATSEDGDAPGDDGPAPTRRADAGDADGDGRSLPSIAWPGSARDGGTAGGTGSSLPAVDRRWAGTLVVALGVVLAVRLVHVGSVFRSGAVVLPANDPYYYRHWVERVAPVLAGDPTALSRLPAEVAMGEPLLVAVLALLSGTAGGDPGAVGVVLALYPPVAALVTGVLVYLTAVELAGDRRVGLVAVLALAVTPVHALRTGIGFTDHHAFDYVWLALTVLALVRIAIRAGAPEGSDDGDEEWVPWSPPAVSTHDAAVLGVGIAGQVLAWEAGPLLTAPVVVSVWTLSLLDLRAGRSPLARGATAVAGTALGAVVVGVVHAALGWHSTTVAVAPAALAAAVAAGVAVAEIGHRRGVPTRNVVGAELAAGVLGVVIVAVAVPDLGRTATAGVAGLLSTRDITETAPLVTGPIGLVTRPLDLFGLVFFAGVPYAAWAGATAVREDRPGWLVPAAYAGFLFVLTLPEIRFAGALAVVLPVFAAVWVLHLTAWVDVTARPAVLDPQRRWRTPGRATDAFPGPGSAASRRPGGSTNATGNRDRTAGSGGLGRPSPGVALSVVVLVAVLAGPGLLLSVGVQGSVQVEAVEYRAATVAADRAVERGLAYPRSYVLSEWDSNRMYNYVVNGEADSYRYALETYPRFLGGSDPSAWYDRLSGRVGFVVVRSDASEVDSSRESVYTRLRAPVDGDDSTTADLEHYRLVWASEDGSTALYGLVPGATVSGRGPPSSTLRVAATVAVGKRNVEYRRTVTTGPDGTFSVTVPYPGEYRVGSTTATVSESDVTDGRTVEVTLDGSDGSPNGSRTAPAVGTR